VHPDGVDFDRVADRLSFDYRAPVEVVRAILQFDYEKLARSARITTFLPVLAERQTRDRLEEHFGHAGTAGLEPAAPASVVRSSIR
jgi:hypothetical protein